MDELLEKYAAIPPRQRLGAAAGIVIVLCALHYFLIYDGQSTRMADLEAKYEKKESARVEKEGQRDNLTLYQEKLATLQNQLELARAKLPDAADVPQLLAQLGSRAEQVGLVIDEFQPKDETNKGFYAEIAFDMKVTGTYHEVAMFVDSVGKLDRIVNVAEIKMDKPRPLNSKIVIDGKFRVKAFRFAQEAPPAPAGGKKK
jgi:type IV pilus assembly protein PilO